MDFRRETGGNLGMGGLADVIQIHIAERGNLQMHFQSQGNPVAQCFPEFTLTSGQSGVPSPDPLKPRNLALIRMVIFDDIVLSQHKLFPTSQNCLAKSPPHYPQRA
jgi:hypothetical protein